jgi:uncharacterized membrane protein
MTDTISVAHVSAGARLASKPTRSWTRSLTKTVTWRAFATVDTFVITALITGSPRWAGSIVGIELFTKMALYLLHERAWAHAAFGRRDA